MFFRKVLFLAASLLVGSIFGCEKKVQISESKLGNSRTNIEIMEQVRVLLTEREECNSQQNRLLHDSCLKSPRKWSKSDYNWHEKSSTVLIMENVNPTLLTLGRYRNRMRDVLALNSDGIYISKNPEEVMISNGLIEIFDITGQKDPYFSSLSFLDMTEKFDKTFKDDYSHLYFGHGSVAFSILGEYSPSSSLVYAPPPLAPAELLCAKNWDGLSKFIENASHSFANKVIENEVSVLNMSGGDDRKSIREYFSEKCPNSRISSEEESVYLLIVSKFYSELERLSNIVVVQSAADGGNPDDFPIDCKIRNPSNRLRVHFIPDSANTVMPKEGAALYNSFAYLFGNERNPANECADLYLNAGVDNKGKFNRISLGSGTGFRFERLSFMVASWIAPLASAFIVSQKNAVFYGMNGEQIAKKILEPGTPAVYDPIGNRQLEAFEKKIMGEPL